MTTAEVADPTAERPVLRAALWMTGAVLSFISMAIAGRALAGELDTFEIMMYRSFIGFALVLAVGGAAGQLSRVSSRRLGLHLGRNLFHFTGQNLWFYAITLIPLAQVFALEFTTPIWVSLAAPFILGEKLTRARLATVALGFGGILLVTRPGFGTLGPGVLSAALAAVGFAGSAILTKRLTRYEALVSIMFWLTGMQAVFGLVMAGYDGDLAVPSLALVPWVVLVGAAGLFAHVCLTKALGYAPATTVMPMDFVRLPLAALAAAAIYGERLDPFVLLGAVVIFGANYLNLRAERRRGDA